MALSVLLGRIRASGRVGELGSVPKQDLAEVIGARGDGAVHTDGPRIRSAVSHGVRRSRQGTAP